MELSYEQFLERKRHSSNNCGIKPVWIPDILFDFQKYVAEYSIQKGRCANFLDTGLGKTILELVTATNYVRATNKPVLILTPLAVGLQTVKEAEKFNIDDVAYTKDGKYKSKIVICNFERLHYLNSSDFECVIVDESSIMKNDEGATRQAITAFLRKTKYRYLFTASPSPNDYIELGTSSEALGYLGYTDMLTKFFKNNEDTISPMNIGTEWVLKGHAVDAFFKWVSSWSISARKPSDLGFDDSNHILPELHIRHNKVHNTNHGGLFNTIARTRQEIAKEVKATIEKRCQLSVELAASHETSVYWCNLNPEAELIGKLDKTAVEIHGRMVIDEKEEILLAFSSGQIKKLITKPKISCFGLNWQHCNHTVFFPTFSYEQWYQAVRRFWRFGQHSPVYADMVFSDGQQRIMDSLLAKSKKADELFSKLNINLHKDYEIKSTEFSKPITLPKFLNNSNGQRSTPH